MEDWQEQRVDFYQNSAALPFINNYFDVKKGVRLLFGHIKDMYKLKRMPTYRLYENNKCRYMTLPDVITRKYTPLKDYWCNHSSIYTFDKKVLQFHSDNDTLELGRNSAIGMNAVIELDSPNDPSYDKAKRLLFFDHIEEFNNVISQIDKKLNELTTDYNIMFSGNGIYIILESCYEDNFSQEGYYRDNFLNLLHTMQETEGLGDKFKVHIDNSKAPWNDFFKLPFTFHESRPRISIPLPKGELDSEFINEHSNVNNTLNDYSLINETIQNAKWSKIW
jgi:hypothetical protein